MAGEEEVKRILRELQPTSVSVDAEGKIVIKDEKAVAELRKLGAEQERQALLSNYVNCNC